MLHCYYFKLQSKKHKVIVAILSAKPAFNPISHLRKEYNELNTYLHIITEKLIFSSNGIKQQSAYIGANIHTNIFRYEKLLNFYVKAYISHT